MRLYFGHIPRAAGFNLDTVRLEALCALFLLAAPAAARPTQTRPVGAETAAAPVGERTRAEVLAASPGWARSDRSPDPGAVERLAGLARDWQLEVVYGHWCSDSAREIPRLIALLDALGERGPRVRWVAVDEQKERPAEVIRRLGIEQVPTLVVSRAGREIGRIVERAEPSIEARLLALLESPRSAQTQPATQPGSVERGD